jgi:hypothetical protein
MSTMQLDLDVVSTSRPVRTAGREPAFTRPLPVLRADAIEWRGGAGGEPLTVQLGFANSAPVPSSPATARIEVARFGAFVPTAPLVTVAVPSLPPNRRRVVTALVDASDLPPWAFAAPLPAIPPLPGGMAAGRLAWFFVMLEEQGGMRLGSKSVHMVGNLNVFVTRSRPVERHVQRAIGLRAGAWNLAMFCVGDGRPDEYTFSVGACEPGWDLKLFDAAWDQPIELASRSLLLAIRTAPRAASGRASVLVHRRSTEQTVPVEFDLEVQAAGAKCYTF